MSNERKNKLNILFDNLYKKREKDLICGIVAGYPDINTSKEIVKAIMILKQT